MMNYWLLVNTSPWGRSCSKGLPLCYDLFLWILSHGMFREQALKVLREHSPSSHKSTDKTLWLCVNHTSVVIRLIDLSSAVALVIRLGWSQWLLRWYKATLEIGHQAVNSGMQ